MGRIDEQIYKMVSRRRAKKHFFHAQLELTSCRHVL
jgi:hypothetical protein